MTRHQLQITTHGYDVYYVKIPVDGSNTYNTVTNYIPNGVLTSGKSFKTGYLVTNGSYTYNETGAAFLLAMKDQNNQESTVCSLVTPKQHFTDNVIRSSSEYTKYRLQTSTSTSCVIYIWFKLIDAGE